MNITAQAFFNDHQGRRYTDVATDERINFEGVLAFFAQPEIQLRMVNSEIHHDRPALAGAIKALEARPAVKKFFASNDAHTTMRFRQSVGVITRIIMESYGFRTTGRKQALGSRAPVAPGSITPGAYKNSSGVSTWFTRSERYDRA